MRTGWRWFCFQLGYSERAFLFRIPGTFYRSLTVTAPYVADSENPKFSNPIDCHPCPRFGP